MCSAQGQRCRKINNEVQRCLSQMCLNASCSTVWQLQSPSETAAFQPFHINTQASLMLHAQHSLWANYMVKSLCAKNKNLSQSGLIKNKMQQDNTSSDKCYIFYIFLKARIRLSPQTQKLLNFQAQLFVSSGWQSSCNKLTCVRELCNSNHSLPCLAFQVSVI